MAWPSLSAHERELLRVHVGALWYELPAGKIIATLARKADVKPPTGKPLDSMSLEQLEAARAYWQSLASSCESWINYRKGRRNETNNSRTLRSIGTRRTGIR